MSEITERKTNWKDMKGETGTVNHLGYYVRPGLHKCQLCQNYDDPRRVSICLENHKHLYLCWTCAAPHLLPFLETVFDPEELDVANDQGGIAYPKDPSTKKDDSFQLPANHPKILQESLSVEPKI